MPFSEDAITETMDLTIMFASKSVKLQVEFHAVNMIKTAALPLDVMSDIGVQPVQLAWSFQVVLLFHRDLTS